MRKNAAKPRFFTLFLQRGQDAPKAAQDGPGAAQEPPKSAPRAPQERPRAAQERPRAAQERPRAAQEPPKSAQELENHVNTDEMAENTGQKVFRNSLTQDPRKALGSVAGIGGAAPLEINDSIYFKNR